MKVYTQDDIPDKNPVFIYTEPNKHGVRHVTIAIYSFEFATWMIGTALNQNINTKFKWIYPPKELIEK